MIFRNIIVVFVNFSLGFSHYPGEIIFPNDDTLYLDSTCIIKSADNRQAHGICTKVDDCFVIYNQIRKSNFNHTVCGYEGIHQIVCCPWQYVNNVTVLRQSLPEIGINEINLNSDFKCTVKWSGQNGILKFVEDCPELQENIEIGEQDFCNQEVCKNLVCCPLAKTMLRYNPVCKNVDRLDSEITLRLNVNTPCTVIGLNVPGIYQTMCNAYDRKDIAHENVVVMCTNFECFHSYCCPILGPTDIKYCTRRVQNEFPSIEFVGPNCIDSLTHLPGRCRTLYDCPAYRQGRQNLDECGTDCCTQFYCCPEEVYKFQSISMKKCFGYRSTLFRKQVSIEKLYKRHPHNTKCSMIQHPIVGGYHAKPGDFPHMAALGYTRKHNGKLLWNCGGSLISEKFILTAAHCLKTTEFGQVKTIRLGSLYLENMTKSDECAEDFGVKRVIPHPSYNRSFVYNDIGLIELDREVKYNFYMRPICLPASAELPTHLMGMGWGLLGPGGGKSETLYYGHLEAYAYDECNKTYEFNLDRRSLNGIDDRTQFCAGSRKTVQSTCTGDSGGPIISKLFDDRFEINKRYVIHGITSFGTVCGFANSPGVNTRIYPYVKWIESLVWP